MTGIQEIIVDKLESLARQVEYGVFGEHNEFDDESFIIAIEDDILSLLNKTR